MRRWHGRLAAPGLVHALAVHPRLLEKLQRPYINRRWSVERRFTVLDSHYRFFEQHLDAPLFRALYQPDGIALAQMDSMGLVLQLGYEDQFEKEGELILSLRDSTGLRLVSAAFTVDASDVHPHIIIGGLQGATSDQARDLAKKVTKQLHGLRPKPLMLFVLQVIASCWGMTKILGVADHSHIYSAPRLTWKGWKPCRILASYDDFWKEYGGSMVGGGFYSLPLNSPERPRDEIDARKRALYARRYSLMADLRRQIQTSFELMGQTPFVGK